MSELILVPTSLNPSTSKFDVLTFTSSSQDNHSEKKIFPPYHWNDRDKLFKDYNYIFQLYEKYLALVTISLNRVHGVDQSIEYWRIIVGPWLHYFISISLDRYETVRIAAKNYDIKYTELPIYEIDEWVPIDYVDFNEKYYSDEWNYYLFSEIIKYTKLINTKESPYELSPNNIATKNRKVSLVKSLLFLLTRLTRNFYKKVLFVEVDIPQTYLYKLLYRLKSLSFSYYLRVRPNYHPLDHNIRDSFFEQTERNTMFEGLLDSLIPINIPTTYLEGFKEAEEKAKKIFPSKVEVVITSNAYFSNEHFKLWVASQKLYCSQLWVLVHGGHHGTALFNGPGKLTEDIADRFYCWGWGQYNLPSPKLSSLRPYKLTQSANNILFIPYSISKYSNHIDSSPIASSFDDCLKMHCNFFEALKEINLNHKILIRLKSGFVLRNLEEEYYQQSGLTNFVYSDEESILDSISRSELIIVTYDSTVFLESLTLNKPTCLFIRKDFWEMSKESLPYFEDFVACGILHYDETSLAQHVLKIQDDYSLWWQSDLVQHSVNAFLKKFGLSNDDWDEDWYNEINTYLKINK